MRAKKVFENINFERGQDPKTSMDIGMKHLIELSNAYELEGPMSNKEEADELAYLTDQQMYHVKAECEANEIYDDRAMDMVDDVFWGYEDEFLKLGYKLTDDWV